MYLDARGLSSQRHLLTLVLPAYQNVTKAALYTRKACNESLSHSEQHFCQRRLQRDSFYVASDSERRKWICGGGQTWLVSIAAEATADM